MQKAKSSNRSARLPGVRALSASSVLSTKGLWDALAEQPAVVLHRIVLGAVPAKALEVIALAAGIDRLPKVLVPWRGVRGPAVYVLETDVGTFRVAHSSWGWRADELEREDVFVKEPGVPIDPRPASKGGEFRIVKPAWCEIGDEAWRQIEYLFERVGGFAPKGVPARYSNRAVLSGIVYRLRRNVNAWRDLPAELGCGDGSTTVRRLRSWEEAGIWDRVRAALEVLLEDGRDLDWESLERGKRGDGLTRRQRAFLLDLRQHSELVHSIRSYSSDYRCSYETGREDLSGLVKRRLVMRRRQGRCGFLYSAPSDLGKRFDRLRKGTKPPRWRRRGGISKK